MKTFIALLRGINVSGKNIIKMDSLKKMFSDMNFTNIKTYIQSGNVIFSTTQNLNKEEFSLLITNKIYEIFKFNIPIVIIEIEEIENIISKLPFENYIEKNIYITFTNYKINKEISNIVLDKKTDIERVHIHENVIYLDCPNGYGNTKLTNTSFEKILKTSCTTRNLNTCKKVVELITK